MRMRRISFANAQLQGKKRMMRREEFLGEMERVVPWSRLLRALEPRTTRRARRPPIGLERILRLYFVPQRYAFSDDGLENAVSHSPAIRMPRLTCPTRYSLARSGIPTTLPFLRAWGKCGGVRKLCNSNRLAGN